MRPLFAVIAYLSSAVRGGRRGRKDWRPVVVHGQGLFRVGRQFFHYLPDLRRHHGLLLLFPLRNGLFRYYRPEYHRHRELSVNQNRFAELSESNQSKLLFYLSIRINAF